MFRQLHNPSRSVTLLIAMLQLTTLPATCVLHLNCTHHAASCQPGFCAGSCADFSHSASRDCEATRFRQSAAKADVCECGHNHGQTASRKSTTDAVGSSDTEGTQDGRPASSNTESECNAYAESRPESCPGNPQHGSHDHESCRICQSAFALTTFDVAVPAIEFTTAIPFVSHPANVVPARPRLDRWLCRGPPC